MTGAGLQILISLADDKKHGYAIMREISTRTNGRINLYPGTLYANIKRLLESGLLEELEEAAASDSDDERRRYYRLTPKGRKSALREIARLEAIVQSARRAGLVLKGQR